MILNIFRTILNRFQNSYKIHKICAWIEWKLFLGRHFLPLGLKRGDWSLHIDDFEAIFKKIKIKKQITLVELGCGVSTIIFGVFLSRINLNNCIYSFEGDEGWVEEVKKLILKYGLGKQINLYHIPYKKYANNIWFDENKISENIKNRQIDILIVDAPPGTLCSYSRKPAIPFFLPWLHKESMVFIHDIKRKDEIEIVEIWRRYFKKCELIDTHVGIVLYSEKHDAV